MAFEVDRQDIRTTRTVACDPATLHAEQVRLRVERFAFTSNNVSYAISGDLLDYWGFFPTDHPWGRIPAIGIGVVTESAHTEIPVGRRYFGFYPMADEHIVQAEPTNRGGFRDAGAHRSKHATLYTDFVDIELNPSFDLERTDEYLLLWGMFMTSFLVDDQLGERGFEGATNTLVTSASSKTSISLASCLAARADVHTIGLTSERNRAFVTSLGLYDEVATYDEVTRLDPLTATGVVDMAGNAQLRAEIHHHFGDALTFSISVGATHWDQGETVRAPLPGAKPEFFFAPGQRAKREQDWGPAELNSRIDRAYRSLVEHSRSWLNVEYRYGSTGIEATYTELLNGTADPSAGFICIPSAEASSG